jgi:hypothetical protein
MTENRCGTASQVFMYTSKHARFYQILPDITAKKTITKRMSEIHALAGVLGWNEKY